MIIIEDTEVIGWRAAIHGMRNPMNSWGKSDSFQCDGIGCCFENCTAFISSEDENECGYCTQEGNFIVGKNDLDLMKRLVRAGTDHSKFMRMINVTCDITAPLYWWKEMDTYKVGTVRNSCSTMHTIHKRDFLLEDFSHEHLAIAEFVNEYGQKFLIDSEACLKNIIVQLNYYRALYNSTKDKDYWYQIIQLLPSSYNQMATLQMNYAVLRNIYHSRKNHKLDEWHKFCAWIEKLPYSELITE